MLFSFSFNFNVPGFTNPFSSHPESEYEKSPQHVVEVPTSMTNSIQGLDRKRPPPSSISPTPPLCKKRGWVPSSSELSLAAAVSTSTSGFLDTPAKYREFAELEEDHSDDMIVDLPPAKRRRGLTGSIVSTAFSAALIGAAVGLTVYRMWSNRGREHDTIHSPPPPYEEEWIRADTSKPPPSPSPTSATQSRNRKTRTVGTVGRRSVGRHRRTRTRPQLSVAKIYSPAAPHFDFARTEDEAGEGELEDQMDWIGDKVSRLITEGKRALGKEVVIMSDAQEDEVDDDAEGWEEEEGKNVSTSTSRRGSSQHQYISLPSTAPIQIPSSSSSRLMSLQSDNMGCSSQTYTRTNVTPLSSPRTPGQWKRSPYGLESPSHLNLNAAQKESEWQSDEIRESMEKARAAYLQRRAATGGSGVPSQ